jgi:superfamily II DNA or RNA helicase
MQTKDHPETISTQAFLLRPYQQRAVEWAMLANSGLIIAPAGCGKTLIASSIIKHAATKFPNVSFGWLAPTRETCNQATSALIAAGVDISRVEVRCPHESVDFSKKAVLIVDEAKHAPAETWRRIIESCPGSVFGFDATPWCDDPERNAALRYLFANNSFEIKREELQGVLAHATVHMSSASDQFIEDRINDRIEKLFNERKRYMRIRHEELRAMCAWESITEIGICENMARNAMAIMFANCSLGPTLVLVPRVTLGEEYARMIEGSVLVHSKMKKSLRKQAMDDFKAGRITKMIATSLADEGLDLPNVENLIMVSGGRSAQKTIQRASRALRRTETKTDARIYDFLDNFHPMAIAHAKKRIKCYKELGCHFA